MLTHIVYYEKYNLFVGLLCIIIIIIIFGKYLSFFYLSKII